MRNKKYLCISLVLCLCFAAFPAVSFCAGEAVAVSDDNFPDPLFRLYVSENFDTDGNGLLSASEIDEAQTVYSDGSGISSFEGIEYLTNLRTLIIYGSEVSSLDTRSNAWLERLVCVCTNVSSLDLRKNTKLTNLTVFGNDFDSLDISRCSVLAMTAVTEPQAMTGTYGGQSYELYRYSRVYADGSGHIGSSMITVEQGIELITEISSDPQPGDVPLDEEHFPDEGFRNTVAGAFDKNHNEYLSAEEIEDAKEFHFTGTDILSAKGIEYLTELEIFSCSLSGIEDLDLSSNTKLKEFECRGGSLRSIDFGNLSSLESINLLNNRNLGSIDLSRFSGLVYLNISSTAIGVLDLSGNPDLKTLSLNNTRVKSLDVRRNTKLEGLYCTGCHMERLALGKLMKLQILSCYGNELEELDVSRCPYLMYAYKLGRVYEANGVTHYMDETNKDSLVYDSDTELVTVYSAPELAVYAGEDVFCDAAGREVAVASDVPCRVGYIDPESGEYLAAECTDSCCGLYAFTLPEGVTEAVIVLKGDADLNGKLTNADSTKIRAYLKNAASLSALQRFAADADGNGYIRNSDSTKIKAFLKGTGYLDW